jgi:hypothetical protein
LDQDRTGHEEPGSAVPGRRSPVFVSADEAVGSPGAAAVLVDVPARRAGFSDRDIILLGRGGRVRALEHARVVYTWSSK